jgi:hypothetical protein
MDTPTELVFIKGQNCVYLLTSPVPRDITKTVLTPEKLKELGKLVASRM